MAVYNRVVPCGPKETEDRKKDPLSCARPALARVTAGQQSFPRMEIDTGSAQARQGLDCARRVLRSLSPRTSAR